LIRTPESVRILGGLVLAIIRLSAVWGASFLSKAIFDFLDVFLISFTGALSASFSGLKHYLLIGTSPLPVVWIGFVMISLLSYGLVTMIMRRQERKELD